MFGDSPLDYMDEDERKEHDRKTLADEKLRKARYKKHRPQKLSEYSLAELKAEIKRRQKEISYQHLAHVPGMPLLGPVSRPRVAPHRSCR